MTSIYCNQEVVIAALKKYFNLNEGGTKLHDYFVFELSFHFDDTTGETINLAQHCNHTDEIQCSREQH